MRRLVHAVLVATLLTACSGTEPATASLPGTYTLVTINGKTLQAILDTDGFGTRSAVLTIGSDGRYSETIVAKRPPGWDPPETQLTIGGVWTDMGGTYDFEVTSGLNSPIPFVGTLSGRTLELRTAQGAERGYQK